MHGIIVQNMNHDAMLSPATTCVTLIAFAPAIALGLGRFAYALILPDMRATLDWTYVEAGWLGTVNATGYLAGALLTDSITSRFGLTRVFYIGVWVTVATLFAIAVSDNFIWLSVWRFMAGVFGAFCFVVGGTLAAAISSTQTDNVKRGRILGLFYAGPGFGILLSGILIPPLLGQLGSSAWPFAWVLLGCFAALLGGLSMVAVLPEDRITTQHSEQRMKFRSSDHIPILFGYGAFGAGYIGYMTFMFIHLSNLGASTAQLVLFWGVLGIASMATPWLWARVLENLCNGTATALLILVTFIGAAVPLFSASFTVAIVSAAVFGSALFAVPAATTVFVRRNIGSRDWPHALGVLTVAFGLGQVIGPLFIGYISDNSGNITDGLIWGCAFLLAGISFSALQRDTAR